MGSMYSFWRQLNKEQKQAKQRYLQLLYNLQFRNLVSNGTMETLFKFEKLRVDDIIPLMQAKTVPIAGAKPPQQPEPSQAVITRPPTRQVCPFFINLRKMIERLFIPRGN